MKIIFLILLQCLVFVAESIGQTGPILNPPCDVGDKVFTVGFKAWDLPQGIKANICARITIYADSKIPLQEFYYTEVASRSPNNFTYVKRVTVPLVKGIPDGSSHSVHVTIEPLNYSCNNNNLSSWGFDPISAKIQIPCPPPSIVPPSVPDIFITLYEEKPFVPPCSVNDPIEMNAGVYSFKYDGEVAKMHIPNLAPPWSNDPLVFANDAGAGIITELRWTSHQTDGEVTGLIELLVDDRRIAFTIAKGPGTQYNFAEVYKENNIYRLPLGAGISFCKSFFAKIHAEPVNSTSRGLVKFHNIFIAWRKKQT